MDTSIFGLRFRSNEDLLPTQEDLRAFLDSPRKEGRKERHGDDLAAYRGVLEEVEAFEAGRQHGGPQDFRRMMVLGVFARSRFFSSTLKSAVEQFKYHTHSLAAIDLRKPEAFIRSAEDELTKLNPKKKDDQAKIARLQTMADQRKKDLEGLISRRAALAKELHDIASYLYDSLIRVQKLCESSIVLLVGFQIGGEKQGELIEDIKAHYKDQIRDALQVGPVTKSYVEELKAEVATLSKQLSHQVLEDTYAMTRVYEAIHDRAKTTAAQLQGLIRQVEAGRGRDPEAEKAAFGRIEQVLVGLVSDCDFGLSQPAPESQEVLEKILADKRNEMLNHVFALLERGTA